jgi:hypothetical protein
LVQGGLGLRDLPAHLVRALEVLSVTGALQLGGQALNGRLVIADFVLEQAERQRALARLLAVVAHHRLGRQEHLAHRG